MHIFRPFAFATVVAAIFAGVALAQTGLAPIALPSGWILERPPGAIAQTGTMPQGMSVSPDGTTIAVVEAGYNPPTLSLFRAPDLMRVAAIPLPDAFGRPVWRTADHVLVAGGTADALLDVDVRARSVARIALPAHSYPVAVAATGDGSRVAVATYRDGAVRIGTLSGVTTAHPVSVGAQPAGLAFDADGKSVFATSLGTSALVKIDAASAGVVRRATTGLHPGDCTVAGGKIYVAQTDADSVGVYDAGDLHAIHTIAVGNGERSGASPNAVVSGAGGILVSLGAANAVAVIRDDRLVGRMPAGWYPTDALAIGNTLYVLDGKGEGAQPNPRYRRGSDTDYIGAIELGSLRAYTLPSGTSGFPGSPQGASGWNDAVSPDAIVRKNGPLSHVFFVLKENRTYDQVLGDVRAGNGDPALTHFGAAVTPNEHAIARRFGLFDNTYTSGEVSVPGHMWSEAAFANDYTERYWPALYGGRFTLDDLSTSDDAPRRPARGYLWDAARHANVTFRDYGELTEADTSHPGRWFADVPSLVGRVDPRYPGWNLDISDLDRVKEWRRDFNARVAAGTLPQLEFIWLPGDHTFGTKPGKLAPASYVAINDYALGQMIDTLSHSRIWRSSAMFVIEDDSQDGADHVSDQRTTFFLVSPYARGGVRDEHYSTMSVLRTIEVILGMAPLSEYDATAVPMRAAFTSRLDTRPYAAIVPKVDVTRRNRSVAYGAALSARLDFSRPDAGAPGLLRDVLEHVR